MLCFDIKEGKQTILFSLYNILVNDDGSCDIYVCISAHTRFEGILEGMEDSDEGPDLTIGSERMRGSNFVAKQ